MSTQVYTGKALNEAGVKEELRGVKGLGSKPKWHEALRSIFLVIIYD